MPPTPVLDRLIKEESCIRDDSDAIRGQGYELSHAVDATGRTQGAFNGV